MSSKKKNVQGTKKKGSFIIILVSLLILCVSALAGYTWYEMKKMKSSMAAGQQVGETQPVPPPATPLYFPLETFTVSLKPTSTEEDRVIYIGLTLRIQDEHSLTLLQKYLPEVRSRLLMIISQQTAVALSTDEGKKKLIDLIKEELGSSLSPSESAVITDVLFNAFIIR